MSVIRTTSASTAIGKAGPVEIPAEAERRDLVCGECGYGIRVSKPAPRCPMCGELYWRASARAGKNA